MKEYLNGIVWGEGLRWYNSKLYFSDIFGKKVYSSSCACEKELVLELNDMPSGLGFLPDGSLLIVSGGDKKILRIKDGTQSIYADLSTECVGLNDMAVDLVGNVYVGAYGFEMQHYTGGEADGWIFHISSSGKIKKVCDGLHAPNGMAITSDGKMLIVADTFQEKLFSYKIESDGTPKNQKIWAELPSGPDGICLDEKGAVWSALPNESKVVRVINGGKIDGEILFTETPLCCVLGGDNNKKLFVVTVPAHKKLSADELSDFDKHRKMIGSRIFEILL